MPPADLLTQSSKYHHSLKLTDTPSARYTCLCVVAFVLLVQYKRGSSPPNEKQGALKEMTEQHGWNGAG